MTSRKQSAFWQIFNVCQIETWRSPTLADLLSLFFPACTESANSSPTQNVPNNTMRLLQDEIYLAIRTIWVKITPMITFQLTCCAFSVCQTLSLPLFPPSNLVAHVREGGGLGLRLPPSLCGTRNLVGVAHCFSSGKDETYEPN